MGIPHSLEKRSSLFQPKSFIRILCSFNLVQIYDRLVSDIFFMIGSETQIQIFWTNALAYSEKKVS